MLMLSMILTPAVPAIATRFIGITDPSALLPARTALMLCGVLIGILMPFGLLLQAATMLSWSIAIAARRGLPLAAAIYGILATALIAGGLLAAPVPMSGHLLLGGNRAAGPLVRGACATGRHARHRPPVAVRPTSASSRTPAALPCDLGDERRHLRARSSRRMSAVDPGADPNPGLKFHRNQSLEGGGDF